MRMMIWGAGAIGGTIGAYLIRAGHDVLFVDVAAEHVRAINAGGLRITGPVDQFTVAAKAVTPDDLSEPSDLILLCTKAQDTRAATESLAPWLRDEGCVVSVQNGLNELIIAEIVGERRTLGAFINFSADYHGPGEILYGGRGAVALGELDGRGSPRLRAIGAALRDFDRDAIISDNIWGYLWGKEAYGAMLFISALTHQPISEALAAGPWRSIYIRAAQEILQLAVDLGITPLGFNGFEPSAFIADDRAAIDRSLDTLVAFNSQSAKTHSGIWRDLAVRKRKTEVAMYQPILAEGAKAGHDLPLTRRWIKMIHEIENGDREQDLANLDQLLSGLA